MKTAFNFLRHLPRWGVLAGLLAWLGGCVDPYLPAVPAASTNYLVVSGFINAQGVTSIQLSRSLALSATGAPPAESGARVAIVGSDGQRIELAENPKGTYTSDSLRLNPTLTYQLRIVAATGWQYTTDPQAVKVAPPIDQLHWRYENNGVQLYADTHDDTRASTYYRWQYDETWQFTSTYESHYQYNATTKRIEERTNDIYHCWRTESSTAIMQHSTAAFSQDVVKDFPLLFIPSSSLKLYLKYSILLHQLTETADEYAYWETLRKNNQLTGTVNDPLPTQLTGNVRSLSDPSEVVLGYVGVHGTSTQRIFIARTDVPFPTDNRFDFGNDYCPLALENRCLPRGKGCLPRGTTQVFDGPYFVIAATSCDTTGCDFLSAERYYGSTPECVDCRLRGTNVKPSFWK